MGQKNKFLLTLVLVLCLSLCACMPYFAIPTVESSIAQAMPQTVMSEEPTLKETAPEETTPEETTPEETTPEETTPVVTEPDFTNEPDPDGTKRY